MKVTRGGERILPLMPNLVGDLGKWMKECQAELQELLELEIDHVVIFLRNSVLHTRPGQNPEEWENEATSTLELRSGWFRANESLEDGLSTKPNATLRGNFHHASSQSHNWRSWANHMDHCKERYYHRVVHQRTNCDAKSSEETPTTHFEF